MFELSNELVLSFKKIGLYFFIFIITIQTLFIFWSLITSFDFCKKYWKEAIAFGLKTLLVEKFKENKVIVVASQNQKILIIDNAMEDLFALKKESFIVEEVKIIKKYKYTPKTKEELEALIKNESIHLGDIDTKHITDMSYLFAGSTRKDFSGIESWNTGRVKTMRSMFEGSKLFNEDIGTWDVGNVGDMAWMFLNCSNFNQDISKWDVGNVETMAGMFWGCKSFNQNIFKWNIKKVKDMSYMFKYCKLFNQDLSFWDTIKVDICDMFYECSIDDSNKPKYI
ncbi:DUF285 domain-containing protein [Campylobacter coli]|nr:DUF285 domain-containing protein [Campylobacter coli]